MRDPNVPNLLWVARQKAGLSQRAVARRLGHRSSARISDYETGRRLPSLPTALKLGVIYRTALDELFAPLRAALREALLPGDPPHARPDGDQTSTPGHPR
jgi:transcriptional regulator with XRE-family HTH domain